MQFKKGSSNYVIPFEMPFVYVHPQVEQRSPQNWLEANNTGTSVQSVAEAIERYLAAFREQFTGEHGVYRKRLALGQFVVYLQTQHHSLRLGDLTFEDGRAFLDSLCHAHTQTPMSVATRSRYKSALRSFSRFLLNAELLDEDVFFALTVQ